MLADSQYSGQHLHGRLARDEAQPFTQLDRAPGNAVQQRGGARLMIGPTAGEHRGASAGSGGQQVAQLPHLGSFGAGQDDSQRIEQHQFYVPLHRLGDVIPSRLCDKLRQFFDLLTHGSWNSSRSACGGW